MECNRIGVYFNVLILYKITKLLLIYKWLVSNNFVDITTVIYSTSLIGLTTIAYLPKT